MPKAVHCLLILVAISTLLACHWTQKWMIGEWCLYYVVRTMTDGWAAIKWDKNSIVLSEAELFKMIQSPIKTFDFWPLLCSVHNVLSELFLCKFVNYVLCFINGRRWILTFYLPEPEASYFLSNLLLSIHTFSFSLVHCNIFLQPLGHRVVYSRVLQFAFPVRTGNSGANAAQCHCQSGWMPQLRMFNFGLHHLTRVMRRVGRLDLLAVSETTGAENLLGSAVCQAV